MRQRSGFTLVELLIVIAIVSMLVGMVMPSLGRARELARRAACKANLKAIGNAMYAYATQSNTYPDVYPDRGGAYMVGAAVTDPKYSLKGNSCSMYLLVRLGDVPSSAFICPSTDHQVHPDENSGTNDDFRSHMNLSYSMQVQRREQTSAGVAKPVRLNSEPTMAYLADRTPLTGDTSWKSHSSGGSEAVPAEATLRGGITDADGQSNVQQNSYNHEYDGMREGQNVLYVDQHVEWKLTPNSGIDGDNIWTWDDGSEAGSTGGRNGADLRNTCAAHRRDSFLFP